MNPGYDFPPTPVLQCTVTRENFVAPLRILSRDGMVTTAKETKKSARQNYLDISPCKNSIKWKIMDSGRHSIH